MKKYLTILFACLLLLAGMHITIATHFCGGELAATKISVAGTEASCGMAHDELPNAYNEISFSSNCCENETNVYAVDEDYSASEFNFKDITWHILQIFYLPEGYLYPSNNLPDTHLANVSPPDNYRANSVSMADICIFRI